MTSVIFGSDGISRVLSAIKRSKATIGNELPGLQNLGNTCYLNSVLQALVHNRAFMTSLLFDNQKNKEIILTNARSIFVKDDYFNLVSVSPVPLTLRQKIHNHHYHPDMLTLAERDIIYSYTLTFQLYALFVTMKRNSYVCVPMNVVTLLFKEFKLGVQHDASDVYVHILDRISRELHQVYNAEYYSSLNNKLTTEYFNVVKSHYDQNYTLLTEVFTGFQYVSTACPTCQNQTNRFEFYNQLSIPIRSTTLAGCLQNYTSIEILDFNNMWWCNKCHMNVQGRRQIKLWNCPATLVIQLKRFTNDQHKTRNHVDFPLMLNIREYVSRYNYGETSQYEYELKSVINHHGSLTGGHYYNYSRINKEWYQFNDSVVTHIPINQVVTENAYILFYTRSDF